MLVLLDENMPRQLRSCFPGHDVRTTPGEGWAGKKNGELIALAEAAKFDVLLTADQSLSYQQNLENRALALVVISTNNLSMCRVHSEQILVAINSAKPSSYQFLRLGDNAPA